MKELKEFLQDQWLEHSNDGDGVPNMLVKVKNKVEELEAKNLLQPVVSKSLTPHRCPICGGNGLVSGAFYTSLLGCGGTSTNVTDKCRQCDGQGILWG